MVHEFILGIDYGLQRTGVAIAETSVCLATPYTIINSRDSQEIINEIQKIITHEGIGRVVLGMPEFRKEKHPEQYEAVQKFLELLAKHVSCPIETIDESFTSQMAQSITGRGDDAQAATIILQTYLDHKVK